MMPGGAGDGNFGPSPGTASFVYHRAMSEDVPNKEDRAGSGFFRRLRERFGRSSRLGRLSDIAEAEPEEDTLEALEDLLLSADCGWETAEFIVDETRRRCSTPGVTIRAALRAVLLDILEPRCAPLTIDASRAPFVILVVGVNGAGKTTTIGKLARRLAAEGHKLMLAAGDTWRAAAIEQLTVWGERNDVPVISQEKGADPGAVVFDAHGAAQARGIDVLIADTAGRLQNQAGLMRELEKIVRVLRRRDDDAPHETLLVIDAGMGQNALVQARAFHAAVGLTGIALTKLDTGARGGTILSIARELDVPLRFIGVGEAQDDMAEFSATEFVDALLGREES